MLLIKQASSLTFYFLWIAINSVQRLKVFEEKPLSLGPVEVV